MRILAFLCCASALCASCAPSDPAAAARADLPPLREKLKQALERGDHVAAAERASELLAAGETDRDFLLSAAECFHVTRRPKDLIASLERLFEQHGRELPSERSAELWMIFGRACGLSSQLGPFLAPWAQVREAGGAIGDAAERGLVTLLEFARAAGHAAEARAKLEEAMRRAPALAETLSSFLPLLGTDRSASTAARRSIGRDAVFDAAQLAAEAGRFDEAREGLQRAAEELATDAPERQGYSALLLSLDLAAGAPLEPWLARPLRERDAVLVRASLGRLDEALARLAASQGSLAAEEAQSLHLKLLREAGRGEEALALLDHMRGDAPSEPGPARLARARILLELGRFEEARAAVLLPQDPERAEANPIAAQHVLALVEIFSGRSEEAKAAITAARRIFPVNAVEVEDFWGPAMYLLAPATELEGIAYAWTRFPHLKDNDRHFHAAMRALLLGDRAQARTELERCVARSIAGEYPCRLAESALRAPALQQ